MLRSFINISNELGVTLADLMHNMSYEEYLLRVAKYELERDEEEITAMNNELRRKNG